MVNALIMNWVRDGMGPAMKSTMAEGMKSSVGSQDCIGFMPGAHVEFGSRVVAPRAFLHVWHVRYLVYKV